MHACMKHEDLGAYTFICEAWYSLLLVVVAKQDLALEWHTPCRYYIGGFH